MDSKPLNIQPTLSIWLILSTRLFTEALKEILSTPSRKISIRSEKTFPDLFNRTPILPQIVISMDQSFSDLFSLSQAHKSVHFIVQWVTPSSLAKANDWISSDNVHESETLETLTNLIDQLSGGCLINLYN